MGCLHDRTSCCLAVLVSFLLCFSGCTGYILKTDRPKGVYHRIKKGETLWSIARAYRVSVQEIAEINNIDKPSQIETNEVLFIPEAKQVIDDAMSSILREKAPVTARKRTMTPARKEAEVKASGGETAKKERSSAISPGEETGTPPVAAEESKGAPVVSGSEEEGSTAERGTGQPVPAKRSEELQFERKRFVWPVKGNIVSRFGIQHNGMFYNGIRIAAKEGQQVVAAAGGAVIFSAAIKDYGETVIIKHEDDYATVYTNLGSRVVKMEDRVKKGDLIALLGKGGQGSGTFLNFDVRYKNKARNPLFFLP